MSSHRDLAAAFLTSRDAPIVPPEIDVAAFLASAAADGLLGLLHAKVCAGGAAPRLPPALVDGLRAGAHRQAALEIVQRVELQRIVAAAGSRGLEVLLMKGASIAYDVYPDPAWRVRSDVDMFIRECDRAGMRACLEDLGYVCEPEVSGRLVSYQFHAERIEGHRVRHLCDVHWKIANPQRFADAIQFDELAGAAILLPPLGPRARGLGRTHALWLACVHRAAHHYDQDTLVWLYDVHLLIGSLDSAGLDRFVALSARTGVRRICLRALLLARTLFGTAIPPAVIAALDAAPEDEASARFLRPGMRKVDVLVDDIRALPGWGPRLMLLKEVLFPNAVYMRRTYATGSPAPIAWLYLRRIVGGVSGWFRRDASTTARR
jgi:hypothetical protein